MTKQLSFLILLAISLFVLPSLAFDAPTPPANGWYVLDQSGQMTVSQIDQLNHKVELISEATHNEFALVLLQSLNGDNIEDAAYTIFNKWGIGKHGLDNGILIVLSLKDHKSRIETGKGVGGEITDLQSKAILDGMRPLLRAGNYYGALDQALDQVSGVLESRVNQKATPIPTTEQTAAQTGNDNSDIILLSFFAIIVGCGALIVLLGWWVNRENEGEKQIRQVRENLERESIVFPPFVPTPTPTPAYMSAHATRVRPTYQTPIVIPVVSNNDEEEQQSKHRREEREEEDRRRRNEESSSSSSSSSYDSGSSSSSWGGSDSGGGFGGGGSDGGGSSSSW